MVRKLSQYPSAVLAVLLLGGLYCGEAMAACSDSKVQRLVKEGKSVSSIAKTCKMTASEVRDVLGEDPDEDEEEEDVQKSKPTTNKLPNGTALSQCGCWGFDNGAVRPHPMCRSGYAQPKMCPGYCSAGGSPWRGVCVSG